MRTRNLSTTYYSQDVSLLPFSNFFSKPSAGGAVVVTGRPSLETSASSGIDGGEINRLARVMNAGKRHGSTSELAANLRTTKAGIWILGHGSPGSFETGSGKWGWSDESVVDYGNSHAWIPHFEQLWAPTLSAYDARGRLHTAHQQIILISCSVGGGDEGVILIQEIANITNRLVNAYTGLVYVGDGVYYEKGHRWVKAKPGGLVGPKKQFLGTARSTREQYNIDAELQDLEYIAVRSQLRGKVVEGELRGNNAKLFLSSLFYLPPFQKGGSAVGLVTLSCILHYGQKPPQKVQVYADRVAEEESGPRNFFTAPTFRTSLIDLFGTG